MKYRLRSLEQRQLLVERLRRPLALIWRSPRVGAGDAVFLAEAGDELRHALAIRLRQERAVLIALAIVFDQLREVLFEEGKKNCRGTGLEKQRSGKDVAGSGGGGRANYGLQAGGRIGDAWKHGRATHAHGESCLAEFSNCFHAE